MSIENEVKGFWRSINYLGEGGYAEAVKKGTSSESQGRHIDVREYGKVLLCVEVYSYGEEDGGKYRKITYTPDGKEKLLVGEWVEVGQGKSLDVNVQGRKIGTSHGS